MGKKINQLDLINKEKLKSLIDDNNLNLTNDYLYENTYKDKQRVQIKGRKVNIKGKDPFYWDIAYRNPNTNPVSIIAKDEQTNKYLFVVQLRAPLEGKKMVLSFPAGLIEKDNTIDNLNTKIKKNSAILNRDLTLIDKKQFKDYEKEPALLTGLLELKEETGFVPKSCKMISDPNNPMPKSAGLTNESDNVIECIVDHKAISDSFQEKTEDINIIWLTPKEFMKTVKKMPHELISVENNAFMYMQGKIESDFTCPSKTQLIQKNPNKKRKGILKNKIAYCEKI